MRGRICNRWVRDTPTERESCLQLRATRRVRNPNLQVIITHASHVWSQNSFGLPLRMYGMNRTHFDNARLDILSLVIWLRVFWASVTWNVRKAQRWRKSVLTVDRCRPHSLLLVINFTQGNASGHLIYPCSSEILIKSLMNGLYQI